MQVPLGIFAGMILLSFSAAADTQQRLAAYRQRIDSLDQHIVKLIQERAQVVEQVGELKRAANLPISVPSREAQVIQRAEALAKMGPLPADAVGRIYQKLVQEMRDWETKLDERAKSKASGKTHQHQPSGL
jgi:chorismate mutase-like protein